MNFIPKIEYGLGPTIITFEFPPEGDYLNTDVDASETTNRSFNGKIQTSWGYNQVTIKPHFKLVNEDIKKKIDTFFNSWASTGGMFKYFPHSNGPDSYVVVSQNKKFTPKIIAIKSHDIATLETKFFWEFDLPMILVDPASYAVSGAPVTSVNTRVGDVFIREIYNQSQTDIIATGTDTGLDAKIITVPDTTTLLPERGRLGFVTNTNKFVGYNGSAWVEFGNTTGPVSSTLNAVALYSDTSGTKLTNTDYSLPTADGTAEQILQTDGAGAVTFVDIPPTIITPAVTAINQVALYGDLTGDTLVKTGYTLPVADGTANYVLRTDGAGAVTFTPDLGGDVVGPTTTIIDQLAQFDSTDGKLIKNTAWTVPNAIGTLNQFLTVVGGQDTAWTSLPSSLVYVGGAPVIADNLPTFGGTAGTQIVDSNIPAKNVLYTSGSTQAVVDGGQITLTVAPYQVIRLTSVAPITLSPNIFIIPVNFKDKAEVTLIGSDNTNKIKIVSSDLDNGQFMFGDIFLKRFTSITYTWLESQLRFVEKCRNSQFIISNP